MLMEGLFGQRRFGRSTGEQLPISFSTSLAWPHLILSYLLYSTLRSLDNKGLGYFVNQADLIVQAQSRALINELVTDALELAPNCLAYLANLRCAEVFRFCAIPQVMAIATLDKVYDNLDVYTGVVKVSDADVVVWFVYVYVYVWTNKKLTQKKDSQGLELSAYPQYN